MQDVAFLSLTVFLPALGALLLAFFPKDKPDAIKLASLAITVAVFAVALAGMVFRWVRYRADMHEAAGLSAKGAN